MITQIFTSLLQDCIDFVFITLIIFALAFLIIRLVNIRSLTHCWSEYATLFLYVAFAWFILRILFWSYYGYEAALKNPLGSFRMNSALHSIHETNKWRFTNLQQLIKDHWLLPNADQKVFSKPMPEDAFFRMKTGGLDAERFRKQLISSQEKPLASLIETLQQFKTSINSSLPEQYQLDRFDISDKEIINSINSGTNNKKNITSFQSFEGQWHGLWENMEVDHQWSQTEQYSPPYKIQQEDITLYIHALQYAWIGDGFGWNLLISTQQTDINTVIIRAVYHVRNQNPQEVYMFRPHVGVAVGKNLIWITEKEVFFEQAYLEKTPQQYSITGFSYQWNGPNPQILSDGFQAIYSRNPEKRIQWKKIPLNP